MRTTWILAVVAVAAAGCNSLLGNGDFAGAPRLDSLVVTGGVLVPAFTPDQTDYSVDVGGAISRERIVASAAGHAIQIDGTDLASGAFSAPIALDVNTTTDVHVAVAGGLTYTLHVHRGPSLAPQHLFKPLGSEGVMDSISTPNASFLYGDGVGFDVASDGDTLVLGAPGTDDGAADDTTQNCGAVYVYRRSGATWAFDAVLRAPAPAVDDQLGISVAVSGDTIVAGTNLHAAAYVWERAGGSWQPPQRLTVTPPDAVSFGAQVAIDHDLIVVGAPYESGGGSGINPAHDPPMMNSGAAYVFRRTPGSGWQPAAYLKASTPGVDDLFGIAVAVQDGTVVVGGPQEDSGVQNTPGDDSLTDAGALYVFTASGETFVGPTYVKAAQPVNSDGLGFSVAIDGDLLVAGSQTYQARNGRVLAFRHQGDAWTQIQEFNGIPASNFGASVGVVSDTIVVGAPNVSNCDGRAFVYVPNATGWDARIELADRFGCELFGTSVALGRDGLVVSGAYEDARNNRGILDPSDSSADANNGSGLAFTAR